MDMCYDGTLVMPREFAMMDEEEMTYTEGGGWNGKVFVRNLAGFLSLAAGMDWFLGKIGVDVSAFIARGLANYWAACSSLSKHMINIGIKIATWNAVAAAGFLLGSVAAIYFLGTHEVF